MGAVCSGSTLFASIFNSSVILGNYLQQTTSADNIFRCIFFLGAFRAKSYIRMILAMCMCANYDKYGILVVIFSHFFLKV